MTSRPLLLGHRGVRGRSYSIRENTIAAFDLALQHGCDGFEFDVRLTADDCAVVCHGPRFAAITIARNPVDRFRTLPRLEDVLERYTGRAFLDIELKVPGLESCVLDLVSKSAPDGGYVLSSFLPDVLIDLRTRSQSVPLGIICETRRQLARWPDLPVQYLISQERLISSQLLHDANAAGKKVFAWTVNKKSSMIHLANAGIDGIISDKTDLLVGTLREPD
jgi:glycerophosphoryl diester phosphodiesterase